MTDTKEQKEFLLKALITKVCEQKQLIDLKFEKEFFGDHWKLFKKVTERKSDIPSLTHLKNQYKFEPVKTDLTITDIVEELEIIYVDESAKAAVKKLLIQKRDGDSDDARQALNTLQKEFNRIASNITKSEITNIKEDADRIAEEYEERAAGITKVPTGFEGFDEIIAPEIGHLAMLCMPTKRGKSTVMIRMFIHAIKSGIPALYVSLEMSKIQTMNRILSAAGVAKHSDLKNGKVTAQKYKEYISSFGDVKAHILTSTINTKVSTATIEKYVAEYEPKVVFVDYMTLLADCDFSWNSAVPPSVQLKQIAATMDCLMWTAVQADTQSMASEDMVPGPENVRGNKGWAFDADQFIGGTSQRFHSDPSKFRFQFDCSLHRHGETYAWDCTANMESGDWFDSQDRLMKL